MGDADAQFCGPMAGVVASRGSDAVDLDRAKCLNRGHRGAPVVRLDYLLGKEADPKAPHRPGRRSRLVLPPRSPAGHLRRLTRARLRLTRARGRLICSTPTPAVRAARAMALGDAYDRRLRDAELTGQFLDGRPRLRVEPCQLVLMLLVQLTERRKVPRADGRDSILSDVDGGESDASLCIGSPLTNSPFPPAYQVSRNHPNPPYWRRP